MNQYRYRFGPIERSVHLDFCTSMNEALINPYQPRAVVFPGVSYADLAARLFGLTRVQSVVVELQRLVEYWTDGDRPRLFTKHWTGARGFSRVQQEIVLDYITGIE